MQNQKTRNSLPIRFIEVDQEDGKYYIKGFPEFDGDVDYRGPNKQETITFTVNIAPGELEGQQSPDDFVDKAKQTIRMLKRLVNFVRYLKNYMVEEPHIEGDFYWGETDLNVRVTIPFHQEMIVLKKPV